MQYIFQFDEVIIMIKTLKKLFGGINLTWPKLIISAIVAGILTAVIAMIPGLRYTSFNAITVTLEVWILFGIIIIMNSRSNIDSALKCFVFFLISQPLVYLIQVPFNAYGWGYSPITDTGSSGRFFVSRWVISVIT